MFYTFEAFNSSSHVVIFSLGLFLCWPTIFSFASIFSQPLKVEEALAFLALRSQKQLAPAHRTLDHHRPPTTTAAAAASCSITTDLLRRLPRSAFIHRVVLLPPPILDIGERLRTSRCTAPTVQPFSEGKNLSGFLKNTKWSSLCSAGGQCGEAAALESLNPCKVQLHRVKAELEYERLLERSNQQKWITYLDDITENFYWVEEVAVNFEKGNQDKLVLCKVKENKKWMNASLQVIRCRVQVATRTATNYTDTDTIRSKRTKSSREQSRPMEKQSTHLPTTAFD
ncbi:hypothetical protein M5K25_024261 [Dendrobium thyrsiflorum]|uniref:Uncharacterized protein n=1 Tax=Dendrobium thyrsiflorum TaxID=117978 RepID=A0ABD0U1P0_DENTH